MNPTNSVHKLRVPRLTPVKTPCIQPWPLLFYIPMLASFAIVIHAVQQSMTAKSEASIVGPFAPVTTPSRGTWSARLAQEPWAWDSPPAPQLRSRLHNVARAPQPWSFWPTCRRRLFLWYSFFFTELPCHLRSIIVQSAISSLPGHVTLFQSVISFWAIHWIVTKNPLFVGKKWKFKIERHSKSASSTWWAKIA